MAAARAAIIGFVFIERAKVGNYKRRKCLYKLIKVKIDLSSFQVEQSDL